MVETRQAEAGMELAFEGPASALLFINDVQDTRYIFNDLAAHVFLTDCLSRHNFHFEEAKHTELPSARDSGPGRCSFVLANRTKGLWTVALPTVTLLIATALVRLVLTISPAATP